MKKLLFVLLGSIFTIHLLAENNVTTVSLFRHNGHYFASNVSINNVKVEGTFLIDTGSDASSILSSVAEDLGIKLSSKDRIVSDGLVSDTVRVSKKAAFSINNVEFAPIAISIDNMDDLYKHLGNNCVGIIGIDIIGQYAWKFSQDSFEIIKNIKKYEGLDAYKKNKLHFKSSTRPMLAVQFGIPIVTAQLDTGDNGLAEIGKLLFQYIPKVEERSGRGIIAQRAFRVDSINTSVLKLKDLSISGFKLLNPVVSLNTSEEKTRVYIGTEFFDYYEFIIDFPRKKFYVRQNKTEYKLSKWNSFGFKTEHRKEGVFVRFIWDESPACREGLELGCKILKINEFIVDKTLGAYRKFKEIEKENAVVQIVFQNKQGKIKTISLSKENLF